MPNYIRTKQIDQGDLSGFFVDSISSQSGLLLAFASGAASGAASSIILNETVLLTGNQNISGNKTFLNNLNVSGDLTVAGTLRYNEIIDTTVTGNLSGYTGYFTTVFANNLVYNTGNQTIIGTKTFATGIKITNGNILSAISGYNDIDGPLGLDIASYNLRLRGTALSNINQTSNSFTLFGEEAEIHLNGSNALFDTSYFRLKSETIDFSGEINGNTGTFEKLYANNLIYNTGNQTISGIKTFANNINVSGTGIFNAIDLNNIDNLSLSGVDITITSGVVTLTNSLSAPNLVYNTGNQTISGIKTFADSGVFSLSNIAPLNLPSNPLSIVGSGNTYIQVNIQNRATGTTATADLVITANNGTDTSNYINLGINNSGYADPGFTNGSGLDGYLFVQGGSLDIGTTPTNSNIEFHIAGTTADKVIARINNSGLNLISGTLNLNNSYLSGENIKPSRGIALYNRSMTARNILTQVDLEGRSIAFQPNLATNRIINYQSRSNSISSTNAGFGINLASSGIITRPIYMKVGDVLGSLPRVGFLHTGGLIEAGVSNNVDQNTFRGTGGLGGFFFQARFGISENNIGTSGRGFFGLWDKQTILVANSTFDPYSSNRQNLIGVGFNSGDSNLSFIHSDSTSPGTDNVNRKKVSLGASFPITSGNVYELSMYGLPDKPYVDMNISILKSTISTGYRAITALPAPDYALAPNFSINGPGVTGNIAFDLNNFYIDTQ